MADHKQNQPRSQSLRGETVTKTLVKFVLSFQNFGEKIACAVRHNRIQPLLQYGCVALTYNNAEKLKLHLHACRLILTSRPGNFSVIF